MRKASVDQPSGDFLLELLDHVSDGVYFVTTNRRITFWNHSAEEITGYPREEILGHFCHDDILDHVSERGQHLCQTGCPLQKTIEDGNPRQALVYLRHKKGHRLPVWIKTKPVRSEEGEIVGAVETFSESQPIIELRQQVRKLQHKVLLDTLTGIGNRAYIENRLKTQLVTYQQIGIPFGIVMLDLDFFKKINDTYGHNVGDGVLRMVAQVLRKNLRSNDSVGRWGGEEFLSIIVGISRATLKVTAEKLRIMVENSRLTHGNFAIGVTASFGATLARMDDTIETMVERADHLLYDSKRKGRNRVTVG